MTQTFTWTAADWFTASHWSPSGPPTSNSIALIDRTTGPKVNAGSTVDNVGIVLAAKNAELVLNGGAVGAAATLTDATASYFTEKLDEPIPMPLGCFVEYAYTYTV